MTKLNQLQITTGAKLFFKIINNSINKTLIKLIQPRINWSIVPLEPYGIHILKPFKYIYCTVDEDGKLACHTCKPYIDYFEGETRDYGKWVGDEHSCYYSFYRVNLWYRL